MHARLFEQIYDGSQSLDGAIKNVLFEMCSGKTMILLDSDHVVLAHNVQNLMEQDVQRLLAILTKGMNQIGIYVVLAGIFMPTDAHTDGRA